MYSELAASSVAATVYSELLLRMLLWVRIYSELLLLWVRIYSELLLVLPPSYKF